MVKFNDLLIDKSLYGFGTDCLVSFGDGHQFDFHDVIYHKQSCKVDNSNTLFKIAESS